MQQREPKIVNSPAARALARSLLAWAVLLFVPANVQAAAPPTEGTLQALDQQQRPLGACPLEHTEVSVTISGFIARVTLIQHFTNPYPEPIEAVYTFPMSDRAAVDRMEMHIGERIIKGVVKEREEARRIYEAARQAGQAASLLDQERPNIFTQSVANILPGDRIDITLSYVEYLKHEGGEYEYSFPMVVGPRYIPGQRSGPGSDQVPDARRITPPVTPEDTRAGHDIALTVTVAAGLPIQDLHSVLHEVDIDHPADARAVVRLKNQKEIPNRDFVLSYSVAGNAISDAVLTHAGEKGGFFTLVLHPPARVTPKEATPKEMVFVIDSSGSMRGFPIEKAKKTMRLCIEQMNPNDTFNLISFSAGTAYCFPQPVPNTPENRTTALRYLDHLEGRGGTEMMGAIRAALGPPYSEGRLRIVCFMTDGFIGDDMSILGEVQKTARTARVFAFGIGSSVNRFLIEGMARMGRGAAEIVTLESKGDTAAERFHQRVQSPVLTDITVDFGDLAAQQVYPELGQLPDLFSAQPLVLTGQYTRPGEGSITVRGQTAAGPFERRVPVVFPEQREGHDVLAPLWARARIDALMAEDWQGLQQGRPDKEVKSEITRLGLEFSLVTQYTSFVAVEERIINEGGETRRVEVPVEMPDGVSYEGVFGEMAPGHVTGAKMMAAPVSMPLINQEAARTVGDSIAPMPDPPPPPKLAPALMEKPRGRDVSKAEARAKIDPALQGLEAKLVNGNYSDARVTVQDGWVKAFIRLTDTSEAKLKALRNLGVDVISVAHAKKTVLAKIRVTDLEKVAALGWVEGLAAPEY